MKLTTRVVIPIAELAIPSNKLKTYLNESSEGLCRLCVSQLTAQGPEYPIEDFFFERVMGDEGVGYNQTVSELYKEYTDYLIVLEDVLIKYLTFNYQHSKLVLVGCTDTIFILECTYDLVDPNERLDG